MEETRGEHSFQPAETGGIRVGTVVLGEVDVIGGARRVDVARGGVGRDPECVDGLHLEVAVSSKCTGDERVTLEKDRRRIRSY